MTALAQSHRYRVIRDPDGWPMIPGKLGWLTRSRSPSTPIAHACLAASGRCPTCAGGRSEIRKSGCWCRRCGCRLRPDSSRHGDGDP